MGSSIERELRDELGYEDRTVTIEWRRFRELQREDDRKLASGRQYSPGWWVLKNGREALDRKVAELDAQRMKVALFSDQLGLYTYSGLAARIAKKYGETVDKAYPLLAPRLGSFDWSREPPPMRWYQTESVDRMYRQGHAAVQLPTGSGKSLVIVNLCQRHGLPALIETPTLSIAKQLLADMQEAFGANRVGQFFGGKKQPDKMFVVAVSRSLTLVKRGSREWDLLSSKPVLICDESHMTPAETLAKTVVGMMSSSPYRYFVSGTQMRGDGKDIVLEGITGEVVLDVGLRQLVGEGFLARPRFVQYLTTSPEAQRSNQDPLQVARTHFYKNPAIYEHAGKLIKWALAAGKRPLILMQEVDQFRRLAKHVDLSKVGFAHSGLKDSDQKKGIPTEFHKSDPTALVEAFDGGRLPVLVGTQCIGVGTNIKTADFGIDLVNDSSEVRLSQNIGRCTRVHGGKTQFWYTSYGVSNVPMLARQAEKRAKIMDSIYGPVNIQEF